MTGVHWLPFLGVVAAAYLIPGPDLAVILRATATRPRAGAQAALGAQTGLCVHMLAAAGGLSLLLARLPGVLTGIRLAGAAYLVVLGVRTVLAARRTAAEEPDTRPARRTWFLQGLTTNLLNPKAILFFVALLPQFVDPGAPVGPQVLLLGVVNIALGGVFWAGWIALSHGVVARVRTRRPGRWQAVGGAVFVAVGVGVAVSG